MSFRQGALTAWVMMLVSLACAADPFSVAAHLDQLGTNTLVTLAFKVAPGHHLYTDTLNVNLANGGPALPLFGRSDPVRYQDTLSDTPRDSYTNDFTASYLPGSAAVSDLVVEVHYQGCSETLCFLPATKVIRLEAEARTVQQPSSSVSAAASWEEQIRTFRVAGRSAGYMRTDAFLVFLDASEGKGLATQNTLDWWGRTRAGLALFSSDPVEFMVRFGAWWTILAIVLGGMLLNLTPCVLPMIPINLAIIGVGAQGSSRARGVLLGGVYGLGMAFVYGILGLAVVLTGAQFGALNSKPWFNLSIAALFVVLGLAMFDVITIDFTRFQQGAGSGAQRARGRLASAFAMGGVAALLAGACVAPVVIAVLVLSGNLYAQGAAIGLVLPFLLGVGMALPWPLAGGGLAFLPKPGVWMTWVKYGFGVFIFAFALYYGSLAYHGWGGARASQDVTAGVRRVSPDEEAGTWAEALGEAGAAHKPVFIDFWATWCKNCEVMEATTFRDETVRRRLARYAVVKFQAERPDEAATKDVLDYFGIKGLPTYIVLEPVAPGNGGK